MKWSPKQSCGHPHKVTLVVLLYPPKKRQIFFFGPGYSTSLLFRLTPVDEGRDSLRGGA